MFKTLLAHGMSPRLILAGAVLARAMAATCIVAEAYLVGQYFKDLVGGGKYSHHPPPIVSTIQLDTREKLSSLGVSVATHAHVDHCLPPVLGFLLLAPD